MLWEQQRESVAAVKSASLGSGEREKSNGEQTPMVPEGGEANDFKKKTRGGKKEME